jgi:hypothetical protein
MADLTMADILGAYGGVPDPENPSSGQISPGVVLRAIAQQIAPGAISGKTAREAATELSAQRANPPDPLETILGIGGGAGAGPIVGIGGPARAGDLWHGLSVIKLPRPVSEMAASYQRTPLPESNITPADLQGGMLLPAIGDRSLAGGTLTSVGERPLAAPVELQGGPGYMPANTERGAVWASAPGVISRIERTAGQIGEETGKPVYFPYTAMGERAVDFSHHVSDTLTDMMKGASISRADRASFNDVMRQGAKDYAGDPNWPGINSPNLRAYLADAPGNVRALFAKTMDTARFQQAGFPSVAEARHAVTDPRLLDVPTGSSGLSISRIGETKADIPSEHRTYETALPGEYVGGFFGKSVPKEVMYPDLIRSYAKQGYEPFRFDYLMSRPPTGSPLAQSANQRWVDSVSKWLRENGVALGITPAAMLAGYAQPNEQQ